MKQIKYIITLSLASLALCLSSCSQEDAPEFSFSDPRDGFMPAEDATDEISVMRRQFYQEHGSFILFNDTLRKDFIGKDLNGEDRYFTELLDIKYEVGQTSSVLYRSTYSYLNTPEKCQQALEYLETYILPHLSEKLYPYSWFLAGNIYDTNSSGASVRPYAQSGQRGIVLACAQLANLKTDAQKKQLVARQMLIIVQKLCNDNAASFGDFTAVSSRYYSTNLNVPEDKTANEYVRDYGFLTSSAISSFPSQSDDINAYANLIISYSDAQIERAYAQYPLILRKAKLFRETLEKLGYVY